MAWPAAETDDQAAYEHHTEQGKVFHRNIQQYFSGIPVEVIAAYIQDELLQGWWNNFLSTTKDFPWLPLMDQQKNLAIHPEYSLTARIHDHRLIAKYDLIVSMPGSQFWIYDWKTSLTVPPPERLEQRIQTRLYMWMLAAAGNHLNSGKPISPDLVLMTYWFAQTSGRQMLFPYSKEQYEADEHDLANLMDHITALPDEGFTLTDDKRRCRYCPFRSYCERGYAPGRWSELSGDDEPLDLPSWDDITAMSGVDPLEL